MAGIKNKSMRDIPIMSPMERFQTRGLLGLLAGPSPQEEAIAQAYSQFRQGLQPKAELSGINLPVTGEVANLPAEQGQPDYQQLIGNLVASGPGGVEQAQNIAKMQYLQGMGSRKGGQGHPTTTLLSMRSLGIQTGNPVIDAMSQQDAATALNQVQSVTKLTSSTPGGEESTRLVPKTEAAGGGVVGKNARNVFENDVTKLSNEITKSRLPAIIPAVTNIDKGILQYDQGKGLPGIGRLKNARMSQYLKTPAGRQMFAAVNTLFSEELRQASGLAVTFTEEERARINNALQPSNSVADFVKVYKQLIRPRLQNIVGGIVAGKPPQAVDLYDKRNKRFSLRKFVNQEPAYARHKSNDPLGIR